MPVDMPLLNTFFECFRPIAVQAFANDWITTNEGVLDFVFIDFSRRG